MTTLTSASGQLLAQLLPPVAYDPQAGNLGAELQAEGSALDTAQANAIQMKNALSPLICDYELLADWERVLGLPPCSQGAPSQRIARIVAKVNMGHGDQSKGSYIALAALFGYAITITNPAPYQCLVSGLPTPAPVAACGLGLGIGEFVDYFRVGVHRVGINPMVIFYFGDTIQDLFNAIKPAHVSFTYAH